MYTPCSVAGVFSGTGPVVEEQLHVDSTAAAADDDDIVVVVVVAVIIVVVAIVAVVVDDVNTMLHVRDVTSIEAEEAFASSLFGKGQG